MAQPIGSGARYVFWGVALLTGLTGLVMFLEPQLAGGSLWPWSLTPLVSRYLGALFIAISVGAVLCARAQDWADVRLLFPPGLVFTGLSTVAALLHLASFNPARLATWAFFVLYLTVFVAGLLTYLRYERKRRAGAAARLAPQ
jgi:hypothetical protein